MYQTALATNVWELPCIAVLCIVNRYCCIIGVRHITLAGAHGMHQQRRFGSAVLARVVHVRVRVSINSNMNTTSNQPCNVRSCVLRAADLRSSGQKRRKKNKRSARGRLRRRRAWGELVAAAAHRPRTYSRQRRRGSRCGALSMERTGGTPSLITVGGGTTAEDPPGSRPGPLGETAVEA